MDIELFLSMNMEYSQGRDKFGVDAFKANYEAPKNTGPHLKGFRGVLREKTMESLLLGSTNFNKQSDQCAERLITNNGLDHYILHIILAGTLHGSFNGIEVFAHPGDIILLNLSQVVSSSTETDGRITVLIPKHELEKRTGWRKLDGSVLKAQSPTTILLFNYVKDMINISSQLNATEATAAREAMLTLLASCINGTQQELTNSVAMKLTMRHRILAYIDDNLTNSALKPRSIQQHFHVSRSHLYRAFEADGGVAKVIRDKRLDLAYQLLIEIQGKQLSFKEIAYRCGFQNTSQFTKAFKSLYSISPKEARKTNSLISEYSDISIFQKHLIAQNDQYNIEEEKGAVKPPRRP
ncbi:AraC family transcriptional regulator [Brucella sp. TWI559]